MSSIQYIGYIQIWQALCQVTQTLTLRKGAGSRFFEPYAEESLFKP